jgi:hypothetical protein
MSRTGAGGAGDREPVAPLHIGDRVRKDILREERAAYAMRPLSCTPEGAARRARIDSAGSLAILELTTNSTRAIIRLEVVSR